MNSRIIWMLALLLVSAMAINWYQDRADLAREAPHAPASEPDVYMVNARINQYDLAGRLHHQIGASRLTHYTVTDITQLEEPRLVLYGPHGSPWRVASSSGEIVPSDAANGDIVELWDGVTVERQEPDGRFIAITTGRLTVVPGAEFARTDAPVAIETNHGRTEAGGMSMKLEPLKLSFFSDANRRVKTVVQPASPQ